MKNLYLIKYFTLNLIFEHYMYSINKSISSLIVLFYKSSDF